MPERDKVFLETFGIGYDELDHRAAVVYLRYLSDLSPEHQQYWNTFIVSGLVKLHPDYYRGTYLGEWSLNGSFFGAILEEIKLINQLTTGIFGEALFRTEHNEERPLGLTLFLRPTLRNFNIFVLAMDKILSDNINQEFFKGQVALEFETERPDGKVVVARKGTLTLLEDWDAI